MCQWRGQREMKISFSMNLKIRCDRSDDQKASSGAAIDRVQAGGRLGTCGQALARCWLGLLKEI